MKGIVRSLSSRSGQVAAVPPTLLVLAIACTPYGGPRPLSPPDPSSWVVGSYEPGTHSHNDYDRDRPLAEALEHGFASIEVDVALRNGVLYVTHDSADIDPSRTLADMYLRPLRTLVSSRDGHVYRPSDPPLQLLVDVKSNAVPAYEALEELFADYDPMLSRWIDGARQDRAITVVISGNRPTLEGRDETRRYSVLDGRIYDRRRDFPPSTMPLVSINWDDTGGMGDRMQTARRFVEEVHREGRRVRFWNTPDGPSTWAWLRALDVDFIGTDDPEGLSRFMREGR